MESSFEWLSTTRISSPSSTSCRSSSRTHCTVCSGERSDQVILSVRTKTHQLHPEDRATIRQRLGRGRDALDGNGVAGDGDNDRLVRTLTEDGELDDRPSLTADEVDRLVEGEVPSVMVVDEQNAVAGFEPSRLGGRARQGGNDNQIAVFDTDLGANAFERTGNGVIELLRILRVEKEAVRVAETVNETGERAVEQSLIIDRLPEVGSGNLVPNVVQ